MGDKRYYWLKLKDDFFNQKEIKKLRSIAGGDTYTVIYLKMLLKSLRTEGNLLYEGIEDDFASEIALDIDEDPENVAVTISFLTKCDLLVESESMATMIAYDELVGSEAYSTERSRRSREKAKVLQCNTHATLCNADATPCNEDIDIEKDIDIEIDKEKREEKSKKKIFVSPTLEEVSDYIKEKGYKVDAEAFWSYYESNGWHQGRQKMKSWKAAVVYWNRNYKNAQRSSAYMDAIKNRVDIVDSWV